MRKYFLLAGIVGSLLIGGSRENNLFGADDPTGYLRLEYWPFSTSGKATIEGSSPDIKDGDKLINGSDWGAVLGGEALLGEWGLNMDLFLGRQWNSKQLSSSQSVDYGAEYSILTVGAFLPFYQPELEGQDKSLRFDGFAGIRGFTNTYKVEFEPYDPNNNQDKSDTRSWVDPYLGLRLDSKLSENWGVELYGDVGGFGIGHASELSALARANLVWTVVQGFNVLGGYRFFDLKSANEDGSAKTQVDMEMKGLTLGVECRFY